MYQFQQLNILLQQDLYLSGLIPKKVYFSEFSLVELKAIISKPISNFLFNAGFIFQQII